MKLDQEDITRICKRVVDHDVDTAIVADHFEISRRRVQQLAKEYRDTDEIPSVETPGRDPYADHPEDLHERVLELHQRLGAGAVVIAHVLRVTDDLSIANNRVHEILQEYERVTENPKKQDPRPPWVRFEREYAAVTVHMDWYHNDHDQWCLAIEDDASRYVFDTIETDSRSAARSVDLLETVRRDAEPDVPIMEVITDHGSGFVNTHSDQRPVLDHAFERYLHGNEITHTLCKVGRPQSNGKIERFYQTYKKQRWRFESLENFIEYVLV